mgnify:FL=1
MLIGFTGSSGSSKDNVSQFHCQKINCGVRSSSQNLHAQAIPTGGVDLVLSYINFARRWNDDR